MTAFARLHAPPAPTAPAPLVATLVPADAATAALLRLIGTGRPIEVRIDATEVDRDGALHIEFAARVADVGAARLTLAEAAAVVGTLAPVVEAPPLDAPPAPEPMSPAVATETVVIHPADRSGDPWAPRDVVEPEPATTLPLPAHAAGRSPRTQTVIVEDLARDERYGLVCRLLLLPLAAKGWPINGDAETVLKSHAIDFAAYPHRVLARAAAHLAAGRHRNFPDAGEIFAAIGRASKPGATMEDVA
ncbi:MAG: hypothetical protein RI936_25 [Pseudomonadota bacterium]|jgi:hypothetical protein